MMAADGATLRSRFDEIRLNRAQPFLDYVSKLVQTEAAEQLSGDQLWALLRPKDHECAKDLSRSFAQLGTAIAKSLKESGITTQADLEGLGHSVKRISAALRFRRYEHWAGGYRNDEDTVLGEFPAGQADDVWISVDEARAIFIEAADAMGRLLDMAPTAAVGPAPALAVAQPVPALAVPKRTKRGPGPKPDIEGHRKVAEIIRKYGHGWQDSDEVLERICAELRAAKVPPPKSREKFDAPNVPRSWPSALRHNRRRVVLALEHHMEAALRYGL
jgi:hypothetical protein